MEGQTSSNPLIQRAEDALLNSAPTYSGVKRQELYGTGYQKAMDAVNDAMGPGSPYTKAELGQILQDTHVAQIEAQRAPISQLYDQIKQYHDVIPLSERSAPAIARNLADIPEMRLSPSSPQGKLISRVMDELPNLKTVDDVKQYKSMLNQSISPTAPPGEKRIVSILTDKLSNLEENSIVRFAQNNMKTPKAQAKVMDLINQREVADAQYSKLMKNVGTLSEQLGKGRVYGPQDAINFIRERLTPEDMVNRIFSKKDSQFMKFYGEQFPEQMQLMREYQKGILREGASKTGDLSAKVLFNNVNKLEPEIQKTLFSPEEAQKLKDAELYIRSFPKSFNPSGTAHTQELRGFFDLGAIATKNARDAAIDKFIKMAGSDPQMAKAMNVANATIKGTQKSIQAAQAIFGPVKNLAISDIIKTRWPEEKSREKLQSSIDELHQDPTKAAQVFSQHSINPAYGFTYGQVGSNAVQYLKSIEPQTQKSGLLDTPRDPTSAQKMAYDRALDLANNPLQVIPSIKDGTLQASDIAHIKAIYPNWYRGMSQKLMQAMTDHIQEGGTVPYTTRQTLSLFLGQPLDSTLQPASIQSIQAMYAQNQPMQQAQNQAKPQGKGKSSTNKLGRFLKIS